MWASAGRVPTGDARAKAEEITAMAAASDIGECMASFVWCEMRATWTTKDVTPSTSIVCECLKTDVLFSGMRNGVD